MHPIHRSSEDVTGAEFIKELVTSYHGDRQTADASVAAYSTNMDKDHEDDSGRLWPHIRQTLEKIMRRTLTVVITRVDECVKTIGLKTCHHAMRASLACQAAKANPLQVLRLQGLCQDQ